MSVVKATMEVVSMSVSTHQEPSIVHVGMATDCRETTAHVEVRGLAACDISQFMAMCVCVQHLFVFAFVTVAV